MINMMPGLPVSSSLQCKSNRHEAAYLELFEATGSFQPTFITCHQASKMICKVRSLKSHINTSSFLEHIITSDYVEFKVFETDMGIGIRKLGNLTQHTAESNDTVKQTAGSQILPVQLQAKNSDL